MPSRLAVLAPLLLALLPVARAEEEKGRVTLADDGVRITPPPGFTPNEKGDLFEADDGSLLYAQDEAGPPSLICSDYESEDYLSSGAVQKWKKKVLVGGRQAWLFLHHVKDDDGEHGNLFLIMGNEEESRSVWGVYPRDREKEILPILRRSLLTAEMIDRPVRPVIGSKLAMIPPAGSLPAEGFTGFQDEYGSGTLAVFEFPGSFLDARDKLTAEALRAKKLMVTEKTPLKVGDLAGLLFDATQETPEGKAAKCLLYFGDDSRMFLVVGTWLMEEDERFRKAFHRSIRSVRVGKQAGDPLDVLGFRIDPVAPLEFVQLIGSGAYYSEGGAMPLERPGDASFLAMDLPSTDDMAKVDLVATLKEIIRRDESLTKVKIESTKAFRLAGANACEAVVHGTDKKNGHEETLLLVIRVREGGFAMMRGSILRSREKEFLPVFRKMVASFRAR